MNFRLNAQSVDPSHLCPPCPRCDRVGLEILDLLSRSWSYPAGESGKDDQLNQPNGRECSSSLGSGTSRCPRHSDRERRCRRARSARGASAWVTEPRCFTTRAPLPWRGAERVFTRHALLRSWTCDMCLHVWLTALMRLPRFSVCMYVWMYVCMYVIYLSIYLIYLSNLSMYLSIYLCICVCMYVCM